MPLKINEIFYSIQGESLYTGLPCCFIRLSGCNLRCAYCDTPYAYDQGEYMGINKILDRISAFKCNLVEITGGEPLLQDEIPLLVDRLLDNGHEVLMETNGSRRIDIIDDRCVKIVDIKCPSSNMSHKNDLSNIELLGKKDQIKFVIADKSDYDFAKELLPRLLDRISGKNILFSPVSSALPLHRLSAWILKDHLNVRFHIQMHKIIWPDIERGV